MTKIHREKDTWGKLVIYVEKCQKFKLENQQIPKYLQERLHKIDKVENIRIRDIISRAEYYDLS